MIPVWMNIIGNEEILHLEDSIRNSRIMEGPVLKEFERRLKEMLGVRFVIGTASGTASLALALLGIGIKPGDEVIVPDMTFIATANAPAVLGAKVVAAPIEKDRPILDIERIDDFVTDRTRAIITVDLNGRISWSKELRDKYNKRGIHIIDDACQAFMSGDSGAYCGTEADIGCFSFGITKTVSCINGGAVVTNDEEIYNRMRIIKTQGMKSVFDGDKYYTPGFNFKLPDVLASVGVEQLNKLKKKIEHMKMIDQIYREELSETRGIVFMRRKDNEFIWMTDILCDRRKMIIDKLKENEIVARPAAPPIHTAEYVSGNGDYSNTQNMTENLLYLPSGPDQPLDNIYKTIEIIKTIEL